MTTREPRCRAGVASPARQTASGKHTAKGCEPKALARVLTHEGRSNADLPGHHDGQADSQYGKTGDRGREKNISRNSPRNNFNITYSQSSPGTEARAPFPTRMANFSGRLGSRHPLPHTRLKPRFHCCQQTARNQASSPARALTTPLTRLAAISLASSIDAFAAGGHDACLQVGDQCGHLPACGLRLVDADGLEGDLGARASAGRAPAGRRR